MFNTLALLMIALPLLAVVAAAAWLLRQAAASERALATVPVKDEHHPPQH